MTMMTLQDAQMPHRELYARYYEHLPADVHASLESGRRIVFGYTSDLDVAIEWNGETFSEILSKYLKEEPRFLPGDVINSMPSFARIVSSSMIRGLGGEIDIIDDSVCEYLESRFTCARILGGTCAQGATVLTAIGFPVLVHITDRSREVTRLMDGPHVRVVAKEGVVPLLEGASAEPPVRHFILQYPKGARITVDGVIHEAPASNRLIMDFDAIHKSLPLDRHFLDHCEAIAKDMRVYSVSGFNAILDPEIMEKRTDELAAHYRRVKSRNPDCMIYLEDAHYLRFDLKGLVFTKFAGLVDIFGMNDEELVDHAMRLGFRTDRDDLSSVLDGLEVLLRRYGMRGIVLHTKDYSLFYGNALGGVDVSKGLSLGNILAATRARTGRYGSYEDCGETLRLPLSPRGVAFSEQLARKKTGMCAHLVPSLYMDQPTCTIGLGDTFMGGFLISLQGRENE